MMERLSEEESNVGLFYDGSAFDREIRRLPAECPVELAITRRLLSRYASQASVVVEAGVGGGQYAEFLAGRGCRLTLVDVSARLLEYVACKLRMTGLGAQIERTCRVSATCIPEVADGEADMVLLLGPLYRLRSLERRRQAVAEAARMLHPGGVVIAAGLNRLCYLRDLLRLEPAEASRRLVFHEVFLRDGNLDPTCALPIGWAHLSTIEEFRSLFSPYFEQVSLTGAESFTVTCQARWRGLRSEEAEPWLDLVERTGASPEGLAQSDHFLFVGRKK
jgi:SAM-dependent methyltransferase